MLKSLLWLRVSLLSFRMSPAMLIGDARVSTEDQSLTLQINALEVAGCERFFQIGIFNINQVLLIREKWL